MKTTSTSYLVRVRLFLSISCLLGSAGAYAQNVGIGSAAFVPLNMLDVKGNAVVGSGYSGVNTAPVNGMLIQGNVGIGTVSPTEQLHVVNNLRLDGAFMPNNLPGTAGQVLTSQGAGVAPVWSNASGSGSTAVYTVSQTSALAMTNSTTSFTQIPGLTYTLVLGAATNVMIMTDGTIVSSSFGSIVDMAILINGNSATSGGMQRICATGYGSDLSFTVTGLMESWHLCVLESLAAGSYTITVQARSGWNNARNYDSTVGSTALAYSSAQTTTTDANTRKQGVMHIITF